METILHKFITEPLFNATEALLKHLRIRFTAQSDTPLPFEELYEDTVSSIMPNGLKSVVAKIDNTFFIGNIDEDTLAGRQSGFNLQQSADGKYQTMLIFAVDIKNGEKLTRGELAILTRGFNRMARHFPVIVFVRNGENLSLATCERSEYRQDWRDGEKLGKVSILRDINCARPHRGHRDILESIGDKAYPTFDKLYMHWLDVFSSELLTTKFYTELSEWYAWVIGSGKVSFPNDLSTTEDDTQYNHESVIRLITRLIFVWFLKQKKLIPKDFFNEDAIREQFIENFNPHSLNTLFYNPEESKYYRLILQNLFFAMLNRPIKDVESGSDENRRFVTDRRYKGISEDYNINNLLRYRSEFKEGGAERLLELANSRVPFLNGGLFECLDDKDNDLYYDGFSERKASLEQLSFPDYFFFGEEVGTGVDLSAWYGTKGKRSNVKGLINILHSYNFTVEENTPLDQEVSLDPELLGKVFENLLASYNPKTNTTARKQTGSFYTPRDIVKYMVDESLIAHLKRTCPTLDESVFRNLFDYSVDIFDVPETDRKAIMSALYNCKVLDPACGSGAFPMGILQQMVHALRKLDPTNEMWREFILDISLKKDKEAYQIEDEEERSRLRADIEQSFNRNVNDPDYARKLYLIENCIYGVDIQPIATQISKLRFFISLVADQKPTDDPSDNFGIRPLPNLEAKIIAANSLIPLGGNNLFTSTKEIATNQKKLSEANHKLFIAKRNADKRKIRNQIVTIRNEYANELMTSGAVDADDAVKLANWNMFEQNEFAKFFDPKWMFGITDGFDIVIGNPPYVIVSSNDPLKSIYDTEYKVAGGGKRNLFHLFFEKGILLLKMGGVISFITPDTFLAGNDTANLRRFFVNNVRINSLVLYSEKDKVFKNVTQAVAVSVMLRSNTFSDFDVFVKGKQKIIKLEDVKGDSKLRFRWFNQAIRKIKETKTKVADYFEGCQGDVNLTTKKDFYSENRLPDTLPLIRGIQLAPYQYYGSEEWCLKSALSRDVTANERIVFQEVANASLTRRVKATILKDVIVGNSANYLLPKEDLSIFASLAIVNSKVVNFYFKFYNQTNHVPIGEFKQIPFPELSKEIQTHLSSIVKRILLLKSENSSIDISSYEDEIDLIVYHLYNLSYEEVLIIDPATTITEEEYNRYE